MSSKKTRKMSWFKRWLARRKLAKKKKAFYEASIGREKYEKFLTEVNKAVKEFVETTSEDDFLEKLGNEVAKWLNDMPYINLASFKAGTCYGIFAYYRLLYSGKKQDYIV